MKERTVLDYEDITIKCFCGTEFVWKANEQEFYAEQNFVMPRRCRKCRDIKKARLLSDE